MEVTLDPTTVTATPTTSRAPPRSVPPQQPDGPVPAKPKGPTPASDAPAPPHRIRRVLVGVALLAVVVAAWRYGPRWLFGPIVEVAPLERVDLVQTLVTSGHVATQFRAAVGTQVTGVVSRIPVSEGQVVRAGDTLIVLDDSEARALLVEARGAVQQAAAESRQLRELTLPDAEQSLIEATARRVNVEQTFNRNLTALGLDSRAALDLAQRDVAVARALEQSARLAVFTNRPGGSNATAVASALAQSTANLAAMTTRWRYRTILAPRAGVLIARAVEVGEVVQPGKTLMLLAPAGATDIVVQIDEKNLQRIAVGQHALVSADAYPTRTFGADIVYINPGIDLLRASVEVRLRVASPPAHLKEDMTVSVDIETARRARVLVVSTEDLHDPGSAAPWVQVARDGRARRQPVTLGLTSVGRAEILTGLREGDAIIPTSAGSFRDGQRVRVRMPPPRSP